MSLLSDVCTNTFSHMLPSLFSVSFNEQKFLDLGSPMH